MKKFTTDEFIENIIKNKVAFECENALKNVLHWFITDDKIFSTYYNTVDISTLQMFINTEVVNENDIEISISFTDDNFDENGIHLNFEHDMTICLYDSCNRIEIRIYSHGKWLRGYINDEMNYETISNILSLLIATAID